MRRRQRDPHYDTDPQSVYIACTHGYTTNPLYMRCDICKKTSCEIKSGKILDDAIANPIITEIGIAYDPENPPEESQYEKYFGWKRNYPDGNYPSTADCFYKELPRDRNGHLFCQQFCPILRSQKINCTIGAREMLNRDIDKHCRNLIKKHLPGWEKVYVDPETGYYTYLEKPAPLLTWKQVFIGFTVIFILWLIGELLT